jgi:teichuronic acid exporter
VSEHSHGTKTAIGVSWNFLRVIIQTVFSLAVITVLARLLPPSDFGLLTIATIFLGLTELLSSLGMGHAVIQKQDITKKELGSVNGLSITMGAILTVACILIARPAAIWYEDMRLEGVLQLLSVSLLIAAAGAVSRGLLMKSLNFKPIFYIDLLAYGAGYPLTAITLALNDFGVWSLVWAHLAQVSVASLLAIAIQPSPLNFHFSRESVGRFLGFGVGISSSHTVNYVASNIDYLAIGKVLDDHVLGLYSRSYQLVTQPLLKIAVTITTVLFPSISSIQHDLKAVRRAMFNVLEILGLIVFPILAVFYIAAETVILGFFGEGWSQATDAFQILCIAGVLKTVFHVTGSVIHATGHVKAELKLQVVYFFILLIGCIQFVSYGIEAVAWLVVAASLFLYLTKAHLVLKAIDAQWLSFFRAQLPGALLSIFVSLVIWLYLLVNSHWLSFPAWLSLIIVVLLSGASLLLGFLLLPSRLMGETPDLIRRKLGHKLPTRILKWI